MFTKEELSILNESIKYYKEKTNNAIEINLTNETFTSKELNTLNEALNFYEKKCTKALEASVNNKNLMVANNKKQKRVWLVQNKMRKIMQESK